jgi:hypothetical protein
VSADYRGLARRFRDDVRATDARMDRVVATIIAPLLARLRRHPRLREEQIAIAAKLYARDVPAAFRISETVEVCGDRAHFSISEVRFTATWMNSTEWIDTAALEPGIAVVRYALALVNGRLEKHWTPSALVSMHGLSRWFERTGLRDHAALMRDLAVLASSADESEKVRTVGGGYWLGATETMGGTDRVTARARNVRTWVDG